MCFTDTLPQPSDSSVTHPVSSPPSTTTDSLPITAASSVLRPRPGPPCCVLAIFDHVCRFAILPPPTPVLPRWREGLSRLLSRPSIRRPAACSALAILHTDDPNGKLPDNTLIAHQESR
ncbi:hypothetical protein CDEST_07043 [Colletotrichum destructivum]|uniref:Uncharacterized protein n=1 Tax=Colletotrichum destructivum TaxID=34406 RepID=A0AAX4IGI8_9PEZI|nr:hypothetical protein CDEST_07043 [Colletotrichum destructivum]